MLVAKISTKDIENKSMQRIISRCIPGSKRAMAMPVPPIVDITTCRSLQISSVTSGDGDKEIAGCIQPPKRKQQRMTASVLQQKMSGRSKTEEA
jgi:hypothetical protein